MKREWLRRRQRSCEDSKRNKKRSRGDAAAATAEDEDGAADTQTRLRMLRAGWTLLGEPNLTPPANEAADAAATAEVRAAAARIATAWSDTP